MEHILISGFADEISPDFDEQLRVVTSLGMEYISLRTADGKGVADYTAKEVEEKLLPRLQKANVKVSSLGSPIGKIDVEDEEAFEKQLVQMEELCKICKVLDCKFIRMFSFFIPEGKNADDYKEVVIEKLKKFDEIAARYDVVMIHENEKDIYGDVKERCKIILDALGSPHFKAVFDFANFVQCGEDAMECWEMLHDHVAYIHIKDAVTTDKENVLCGTGEGKIAEILKRAIKEEGYQGFLTLEPHLVLFDALQSLETENAENIIKENKAKDGAEGYSMQYHALIDILDSIEKSN
ncbi:MAG: sugar phosphate isomerase/epimerase [Lachnospiraceae bacterium]|nr:sugar phosphate isomerase/epimerase [Lachnospiraceae bacterium]